MSTKLSPNARAIRCDVEIELLGLFSLIGMDTPDNMEAITDYCAEDVAKTADPDNWHDGDVAIAFRRWIEHAGEAIQGLNELAKD